MKARITKPVLATLQEVFSTDLTSPSGLRWKRWNGSTGTRSREVGDVAGSRTNTGTWIVGLEGERYTAMDVLVALHRAEHRTGGASV